MSEATDTQTAERGAEPMRSPLDEAHRRHGAAMVERGGHAVPAHYGDWRAEYDAVRGAAGLIDLSARGRVEVSGAEAVQFLNGMVTNDVKALADGAWMRAAFPNVQGRLLALARVIRHADAFIFDTQPETQQTVLNTLRRFTLAGDFRVKDLKAQSDDGPPAEVATPTALISLQGPESSRIIGAALGDEAARVERGRVVIASQGWGHYPLIVLRDTHTSEDGFDVIVSTSAAEEVWEKLIDAGARPVGFDALEVLRIEAGLPRHGVDADETNVVLEAVPEDAVSFTKGCYVGQEIIARIHWRGHVAKKLTGLVLEGDARAVAPGAKILAAGEDREIGRATSVAHSPRLSKWVALAVVKYDFLAPGTEVRVRVGEGDSIETTSARVASLPLVRGGWHEPAEGA